MANEENRSSTRLDVPQLPENRSISVGCHKDQRLNACKYNHGRGTRDDREVDLPGILVAPRHKNRSVSSISHHPPAPQTFMTIHFHSFIQAFYVLDNLQYAVLEGIMTPICNVLDDRMVYTCPVAWLQQTEYDSNSCSIPLDPRYSHSGQMPFTSLSLVADKTLGVHLDKNNMKGSVTFVSVPSFSPQAITCILHTILHFIPQVYVLLAKDYRSPDKVPQGHILARYRILQGWSNLNPAPTSDLIGSEVDLDERCATKPFIAVKDLKDEIPFNHCIIFCTVHLQSHPTLLHSLNSFA